MGGTLGHILNLGLIYGLISLLTTYLGQGCFNGIIPPQSESTEDTGFSSEGESKNLVRRRPPGLCVAFRFPSKKRPARQEHGSDSDAQDSDGAWAEMDSARAALKPELAGHGKALGPHARTDLGDDDMDGEFHCKRARNIEENKAMVGFHLLNDASTLIMTDLQMSV